MRAELQEVVKVAANADGQLAVAVVRLLGDLIIALEKQPGIDGEKLIRDFAAQLPPPGDIEVLNVTVSALRQYIGVDPLPSS